MGEGGRGQGHGGRRERTGAWVKGGEDRGMAGGEDKGMAGGEDKGMAEGGRGQGHGGRRERTGAWQGERLKEGHDDSTWLVLPTCSLSLTSI